MFSITPTLPSANASLAQISTHCFPEDGYCGVTILDAARSWGHWTTLAFVRLEIVNDTQVAISTLRFNEAGFGTLSTQLLDRAFVIAKLNGLVQHGLRVIAMADSQMNELRAWSGTGAMGAEAADDGVEASCEGNSRSNKLLRSRPVVRLLAAQTLQPLEEDLSLEAQTWAAFARGDLMARCEVADRVAHELFSLVVLGEVATLTH